MRAGFVETPCGADANLNAGRSVLCMHRRSLIVQVITFCFKSAAGAMRLVQCGRCFWVAHWDLVCLLAGQDCMILVKGIILVAKELVWEGII